MSQKTDGKEIASRQKNGQRGMQDNARGIDIDVTEGAAKTCYPHQQATEEKSCRFKVAQFQRVARKEQCLAPGVDHHPEYDAEPENEKFDSPSDGSDR